MIPEHDGSATGPRPPWRTPAWSPGCASAATARRDARRPARRAGSRRVRRGPACPTSRATIHVRRGGRRGRARAGADRADLVALGCPAPARDLTEEDVQALRYVASVLDAGFPLVAFLQLAARLRAGAGADRRRRDPPLPHLRARAAHARGRARPPDGRGDGEPGARPAAARLADHGLHPPALPPALRGAGRGRAHGGRAGRGRSTSGGCASTVAFADLAGYTRFTEEAGEEEALSYVERFIDAVTEHAPRGRARDQDDRRRGDDRGQDPGALTDWARRLPAALATSGPTPRIGIHHGVALYRDGDYFGRDVNLAARVVARARGGEVLVTRLGHRRSRATTTTSSSRTSAR